MSQQLLPQMQRPLPNFQQWLERNGVTALAEDADMMASFFDLAARTVEQRGEGRAPHEQSFLRMWQGTLVAAVELCNIEASRGVSYETMIQLLPRVFATASMYALASACKTDTNWRDVAKIVVEEFRFGAKAAADQLSEGYHDA